ncbi:MAG: hypothetical protein P9M14_11120 [Candidatus Alcyoniella australis]|nr:hypothetical protein [Candidatus Alcyoniella australis]
MASQKKDKPEHKRDRLQQPLVMPGIHRYQFFSDISDRPLTKNLNRAAMLAIGTALAVDALKPLIGGVPQTLYCYECRACYGTQDRCPVGIGLQAELTVSARVADYERFLRAGGLKCVRCGNCRSFCVVNLDLPRIYSTMQQRTIAAMQRGAIRRQAIQHAYDDGLVGRQFIDRVAQWLEQESG